MVRDRRIGSINCPYCGKPMKKNMKKPVYECKNPRCPVIFVRIYHGIKHVAREPRLNEGVIDHRV
jgi:hypothetical protein